MKITAVNNNQQIQRKSNNTSKPISIIGAGLVGGTVGYASKFALPVTKDEIDNFYPEPDKFVKLEKEAIKDARLNELDSIRRKLGKNTDKNTKEFLDSVENWISEGAPKKSLIGLYNQERQKGNQDTQKIFKNTISAMCKTKKLIDNYSMKTKKSIIKSSRDTFKFISTGAAIAVGAAFIHNVCERINNEN